MLSSALVSAGFDRLLQREPEKELLRFTTAAVWTMANPTNREAADDAKGVYEDQLAP